MGRVVYTSSAGVLGEAPAGVPIDETAPPGPRQRQNLYLKSKVLAEQAFQQFLRHNALPVALILPSAMIGSEDTAPTPTGQLVLNFVSRKIPAILEGGLNVVDARDVADAILAAVEKGRSGERYLVSRGYLSLTELMTMLEAVTGVPKPRRQLSARAAMALATVMEVVARWRGTASLGVLQNRSPHNTARAQRELGVIYRPFEDTLRDTVAWYDEHGFLEESDWQASAAHG